MILMIKPIYTTVKYTKMEHYVESEANLTYSTLDAACFDICAAIGAPLTLKPGQHLAIPTAIKAAAENPLWFRFNSRSGLAAKHGVMVLGGIIDTDYRGEWKVILLNTTSGEFAADYVINPGDKIAQVELPFPYKAEFEEISLEAFDKLETTRGAQGFGSSGR